MIQLLLADGRAPARQLLRAKLGTVPGLTVVGEAGTGEELLVQLASTAPTVVVFDLDLPSFHAAAQLPAICKQYPQLRLLVRGELSNEQYVARIFDLGAHGYILSSASLPELVHGLRTVATGRRFLCSAIGLAMLDRLYQGSPVPGATASPVLRLSKRETEVLGHVSEGMTNAEIAAKLFTSKRTIETHRQNLLKKTRTSNTAALIKLAAREGLLPG